MKREIEELQTAIAWYAEHGFTTFREVAQDRLYELVGRPVEDADDA